MKKWSHWLVLVCNDKTCRSAMISMIVFSLLLVQSIAGQQHFPYYHQQFPPVLQPTPPIPRMYVSRVQLVCEVASPIGKLRWIRRGSAMEISAAILVAEGTASADPLKYAVTSTSDQNGLIRSVLTLLTPEPNLQQAAYYCQFTPGGGTPLRQSKDIYVLGNRQYINANMAYHAADTVQSPT